MRGGAVAAEALDALDASSAIAFVMLVSDDQMCSFKALYELVTASGGGSASGHGAGSQGGSSSAASGGSSAASGAGARDALRIFGKGPLRVREEYVGAFYKYDSTRRRFDALPSRSFTATTDAVAVDIAKLRRHQQASQRGGAAAGGGGGSDRAVAAYYEQGSRGAPL